MYKIKFTEPKLCSYGNDITRNDWFVYFDALNLLTGETLRKQYRGGINKCKTKTDRLAQASALIYYWKSQMKSGWSPFGETLINIFPNLQDALQSIIELKSTSCSKRTIYSYTHAAKMFVKWFADNRIDNIKINQVTKVHAREYIDYLALNKNYSGRSLNDQLTMLGTFFNCMVDRDWIVKSPFKGIKKGKVEIGRNIAFTEPERKLLLDHLYNNDRQMFYFTQFIYYCFIRRSELTRLRIRDIDFNSMTIIIPADCSKNKKQESVVIPYSFISILNEMGLQSYKSDWFIFGRELKPSATQYINYNHISTRHNQQSKALGIDNQKGLYSHKHSGVCALYKALKGDLHSIMRQCRHTDISTTQIYLKSMGLLENDSVRNAVW